MGKGLLDFQEKEDSRAIHKIQAGKIKNAVSSAHIFNNRIHFNLRHLNRIQPSGKAEHNHIRRFFGNHHKKRGQQLFPVKIIQQMIQIVVGLFLEKIPQPGQFEKMDNSTMNACKINTCFRFRPAFPEFYDEPETGRINKVGPAEIKCHKGRLTDGIFHLSPMLFNKGGIHTGGKVYDFHVP